MSRTLFENSKAALAFAAVTIVGAVAMVGTSDNSGVLPAVVQKMDSMAQSQSAAGPQGSGSEGSAEGAKPAPKSVFGDYSGSPETTPLPGAPGAGGANPMNAPVAPTAMVNNGPSAITPGTSDEDPLPPPDLQQ